MKTINYLTILRKIVFIYVFIIIRCIFFQDYVPKIQERKNIRNDYILIYNDCIYYYYYFDKNIYIFYKAPFYRS